MTEYVAFEKIWVHEQEPVAQGHDCGLCGRYASSTYAVGRTSTATGYRYGDFACARCAVEWWEAADDTYGVRPQRGDVPWVGNTAVVDAGKAAKFSSLSAGEAGWFIPDAVALGVPLRMRELEGKGGPDARDLEDARGFVARTCGVYGDQLLFPDTPRARRIAAEETGALVNAVAVLALTAEGGVEFCGQRFCRPEDAHHFRGGAS